LDVAGNAAYSYKGLGYDYIGEWYVEVEDQYYKNTSDRWLFSTMNTPVNNEIPTASIDVVSSVQVGDEVTFDGSGCNDSDGDIIFYRWSFGDGTNVLNVESPTHVYNKIPESNSYKTTLIIIDNHGASNIAEASVRVTTNRAPNPVITCPSSGTAGESIAFSSAGSSDPDSGDSIVKYTWSFDDGSVLSEQNPSHTYSIAGKYTVTLTVEDTEGATESTSTQITVKASSKSEDTPGFEIILVFVAMILILITKKRYKK